MLPTQLEDDDGRAVAMFPLAAATLRRDRRLEPDERRAMRGPIVLPLAFWLALLAIPIASVAAFAWSWRDDALRLMGLLVHGPIILTLLGCLIVLLRVAIGVRARHRDRVERYLLKRERCPSCAYSIAGLDESDHGLVRCPECDAAWASERLGEAAGRRATVVVAGL